jgi:hypothetical protein
MRKIIVALVLMLSVSKVLVADMCTWDNAEKLVKEFLDNEVARKANQYNARLSTVGKRMFSTTDLENGGINIKFLPATKYYINGYLIEDYKITNSVGKGTAMSFDLELYNYKFGWYIKTEMRIIDGHYHGCAIKPSDISERNGEISISPYYNAQHFKI